MIYNISDYIKFSLIYSDYKQYPNYTKAKLNLNLLTPIFKESIRQSANIFNCNQQQLSNIINNSFPHNRYYHNRVQKSKKILLDQEYLSNLDSKAEQELKICEESNINYLVYEQQDYPKPLKKIKLSPLILFYQGQLTANQELEKSLAVIGSRDCEQFGKNIAEEAGKVLARNGWWNISGLAAGCDTKGHWGSLKENGLTGAVLAHGLNSDIYPPENEELAAEIIANKGFLISELPPSTTPAPHFFKWRDRIQSGLTKGVFVIETGKSGGTLHTVNYAFRQGKKVYVWEPTTPSKLPEDKIAGNLMLLGLKEPSSNFKIKSKQRLNKIISLSCPRKLKAELDKIIN